MSTPIQSLQSLTTFRPEDRVSGAVIDDSHPPFFTTVGVLRILSPLVVPLGFGIAWIVAIEPNRSDSTGDDSSFTSLIENPVLFPLFGFLISTLLNLIFFCHFLKIWYF